MRNMTLEHPPPWGFAPPVSRSALFRLLDYLAEAVERVVAAVVRHYQWRATVRALGRLDDHTLRDIGIRRGEILSVTQAATGRRNGDPTRRLRR
jgi:uncharacterized protein YjiS (DUF1127 family)